MRVGVCVEGGGGGGDMVAAGEEGRGGGGVGGGSCSFRPTHTLSVPSISGGA